MQLSLFRKALLAAVYVPASAVLMLSAPCVAAEIITDTAPPPVRSESPPPPRAGYVWAPGHWEWTGRLYAWNSGTWIVEHRGHWVPDQWEQMGAQWHFLRGHWDHEAR
jgi:hypothetical protein